VLASPQGGRAAYDETIGGPLHRSIGVQVRGTRYEPSVSSHPGSFHTGVEREDVRTFGPTRTGSGLQTSRKSDSLNP